MNKTLSLSTVNPHGKTHGAPTDENRHVGDLGNIETDAQGNSKGSVTDKFIKIIGPESVIGVCSPRLYFEAQMLTVASGPSSATPALTTSAREATRSR